MATIGVRFPTPGRFGVTLLCAVVLVLASCGGDDSAADAGSARSTTTMPSGTSTSEAGSGAASTDSHVGIERGPNQLSAPTCVEASCVFSFTNTQMTMSGDFVGRAVSAGTGAPLPGGGYGGTGYVVFTGSVAACGGSGTVAWVDRVVQRADGSAEGSWEIVEGSGSGALEGLRGKGAGESAGSVVAADGSGRIEVSGTVTCD